MKKLLYLFTSLLLISCSSDDSSGISKAPENLSTNYVEYKGEKFYLDEAEVERIDDYNRTHFNILFKNSDFTHALALNLTIGKSNSGQFPTCVIEDILSASYKLKTTASFTMSLIRVRKDSYTTLMSSNDLTEPFNPSNVTINKSKGIYSFRFNIAGSLETMEGEYVGEIKKKNY